MSLSNKYLRPLTQKQQEILDFLIAFQKKHGFAPTYENIGNYFGFTKKSAFDCIVALEKKGYLTVTRGISRGIVVKGELDGSGSLQE